MLNEDLPPDLVKRFILEMHNYVGENPEASFISMLSSNLSSTIEETIKSQFSEFVQENIIPTIRNIEIQTAIQVSKTNEFYAELKKITDHLGLQLSKANDSISLIKANTSSNLEKLEGTIKLVNKKADLFELQVLAREVSTMTPLTTFYQFQEWTQSLASKNEIVRIEKELEKIKDLIRQRPTFDDMQNEDSKVIVDLKSEISKEKTMIVRKIGKVKESNEKNNEKIEMTKSKIQQSNEILSKKIGEVMQFIESKPWSSDLDDCRKEMHKKATRKELKELRSLFDPQLQDVLLRSMDIERDLKEYSDVMARFDEVILTKASKEDVKVIHQIQKSFVNQLTIDPVLTAFTEKFDKVEEKMNSQSKSINELVKELASYSEISAKLKVQSKDYTKMMDSIKSLAEIMKHKADKADIYNMFDIVGYRDDVLALNSAVEKLKDLFTQSVVLQHEAIGTFIPSVDPQMTKNRLRAEIGKNLDLILRKLNSTPEKNESKKSVNSKKRLSSVTSIKVETSIDEKLLSSRNSSTKHRRVASAAGHKRIM